MPKFLAETEKAYLAGIIDGEGCFNIHKNSTRVSYTARLMVSMTAGEPVRMLHEAYGGSLRLNETTAANHKNQWYWYATGKAFDAALADLFPYLRVKREVALVCKELRDNCRRHLHFVKGHKGIQRITADVLAYRQSLKQRVNDLNKVGKAA